ncbi:LOW QUALITY PROTEIN: tudor domain-containing protein 1 [Plakobranchus ocellatus]|uniref:Tudor domain-containing protein 1 n=1 Tax=Plakobranchus ocellatus TaxID=259542 RepID=A0AAV3ZJN2_9GAST|nr:LOW QUALITY PROTEIN: tudor domain-containing protein 1 [Plakobranchus ocellatus]
MEEYPIDFLPTDETEYVFTTHIKDPEHFYVHVESRAKILENIMDALAERYYDVGPSDRILSHKKLGNLCAAKFTDDNNWYRARITGLMKTGMIEVQFVDYGNTDYVSEDRVKSLDSDLVNYPVQCYRCALADISCSQGYWTPESIIQFEDKVMDQRCEAYFSEKTNDDTYLVYMMDAEGNSLNMMFGADQTTKKKAEDEAVFKEMAWKKGSKVPVTVAYVETPDLFWCQDQSFANELLVLSEELSRLHMTQGIQSLTDVKPGMICAAKFSEDEAWYRGIVRTVSNGLAHVYFVDYGNTESVPVNLICRLSPGMKSMPALAAKCQLFGVGSENGKWEQEAVEQFEELVVDKEFEMKVLDQKDGIYIVNLFDIVENTDVSSQMRILTGQTGIVHRAKEDINSNNSHGTETKEVVGIGPSLTVGSRVDAFLTWVDSPGDFWVQLRDFEHLVEKLSNELQEFYAQPRPGAAVSPGAFIVAQYSEDEMWYRGLILKEVSNTEVLVLFIDYGNSDIVLKVNLRQVAPAFGEVVPLAFRCALVGVKSLSDDANAWTTDAKSFLEEMTQDGCLCEVVSETESRKLVKLVVNGKDVARELIALRVVAEASPTKTSSSPSYANYVTVRKSERECVTVTHVASPNRFWCQLNKNFSSLDSLMEKLDSHYSDEGGILMKNPEADKACIAQYSIDHAWYRGIILDVSGQDYTIQFVDYGNSEVVPANLVCEPEPRFLDLPVQAFPCSLPLVGDWSHLTSALSEKVIDKELTMEVMEVRNGLAVVELYDGAVKISDQIKAASKREGSGLSDSALKPAIPVPIGSSVKAFTSFVVSPSKFFLQLADKEEELGTLMDDISVHNTFNDGQKVLQNPQLNQGCLALFSEDNQWYRGIITSPQGSKCRVLFVDYGNEELLNAESLRALPPEFGAVPVMAYECFLTGCGEMTWSEEAREFFESIIMDQELQCIFETQKSVKVTVNGKDLKDEMVKNGHLKREKSVQSPGSSFANSRKPHINGRSESNQRNDNDGWDDAGGTNFSASRKEFGNRDRIGTSKDENKSTFGSEKSESRSGFGSRGDNGKSGFGTGKSQGMSGFGSGQRERKTSSGSSTASGEFTYPEPPSGPETALLVHMDEDGTFYLQLPSMEKDILFLAKRLAGSYKNGGGPRLKDTPAKGVVCCAKFPDDGCMYRCLILDVNGGTAALRYVDYGNTAECSTRDLKMLFPDLLQYSVQAFPCKLKGLTWSDEQAEKFVAAALDKNLEVTFFGSSPPFEVEVKTPSGDLLGILTGKIPFTPSQTTESDSGRKETGFGGGSPKKETSGGFGSSKTLQEVNKQLSPTPKLCEQKFNAQVVPTDKEEAYICHIDEDGYFYLQLERDTTTLESVMSQLEGLSGMGQHPQPTATAACAAVFSEDAAWYRAKITSVEGDNLKVVFVDYGNGDVVQKSSIKPLTSNLLRTAPLAFQCQFSDLGPLSEEAQKKLSEYLMDHKVTATFSSNSAPPHNVKINDADGNDLQEMICPSDCYKTQTQPKNVVPAGVTEIEDDGRFYIQLYADFSAISRVQQDLSEMAASSNLEKLDVPEVESACCYVTDQGVWHRGKILNIVDESTLVFDVDTGKSSNIKVSSLNKLPLQFFKCPPYAYECRLKGVESWTDDLRKKFTEMTEDKILNATFYTASSPFRVSLARSIELDLLGLSAPVPDSPPGKAKPTHPHPGSISEVHSGFEAYISHVDPDGTLYIQKVAREEQLNSMSEKLEAALASATTGDLSMASTGAFVCAKFTEDDAWYRAQVSTVDADKGLVSVRFVDYGNTDSVEAERLAALPEEFELCSIPAFARKSWLSGVVELTDDCVQKLKESVLDQVVTVEVSVSTDDCDEVVLKLAGSSLTEMLSLQIFDNNDCVQKLKESVLDQVVTVEVSVSTEDCDEVVVKVAGSPLTEVLNIKIAEICNSSSAETSNSQESEEFADAPETLENMGDAASADKNANALVEEFSDAVGSIKASSGDVEIPKESQSIENTTSNKIECGSRIPVTVSFVHSPSKFYFQLDRDQGLYSALLDQMFEHFSNLPEGEDVIQQGTNDLSIGDLCAAFYTEDESWYRVIVKNIEDGLYTVFFMDHGNTEVVEAEALRILPTQFKSLSPGAREACLAGIKPAEEEWSPEAMEAFKERVEEKSFLADILADRDGCTIICLLELGIPVHEELISKGYGVANEEDKVVNKAVQQIFSDVDDTFHESTSEALNVSKTDTADIYGSTGSAGGLKIGSVANAVEELKDVSVYVSHVKSPSLFWCQLSTCVEALQQISDLLGSAYSEQEETKVIENVNVGDLVVVKNLQDGLLYRSKVLDPKSSDNGNEDNLQPKVLLQFIDFGSEGEAETDHLFRIKDNLCTFPAQAFCCSLDNIRPRQEDSWPQEACQKFSEIVQDIELSLKLVGRDQDGILLVQLVNLQSGQSISSMLVDAGFGVTDSGGRDINSCPNSSTFDGLEITYPLLESTAMVGDTTQAIAQPVTVDEDGSGPFRSYKLVLHTEYDVIVCNDELPNAFHIRLLETDEQFSSLSAEIKKYINSENGEKSEDFCPKVDDPCLVQHEESWHRATVLEQKEAEWTLKLQDSGKEIMAQQAQLKKLPQHLLDLPAQSIACYLAGIVSVEPEWCLGAIDFFKDRANNGKFCIYVLEDAHKGKYGVCMNELDDTENNSVNRAMVDLGYAEVVPGSYIDIQFKMEKTLDTDMLNELEESFNEVSLLRCNADDVKDAETAGMTESCDIPSYRDSYKDNEISSCKKQVDSNLHQGLQITNSCLENPKTMNEEMLPCETQQQNQNSYRLAVDVERIEQHGCPDMEASDAEVDYLSADIDEGGNNLPVDGMGLLRPEISETDKEQKPSECQVDEKLDALDMRETAALKTCNPNLPKSGDSRKAKATAPNTQIAKPIYTWKVDLKSSPVEGSVKNFKAGKMNDDKPLVEGGKPEEEKPLKSHAKALCFERAMKNDNVSDKASKVEDSCSMESRPISAELVKKGSVMILKENTTEMGSLVKEDSSYEERKTAKSNSERNGENQSSMVVDSGLVTEGEDLTADFVNRAATKFPPPEECANDGEDNNDSHVMPSSDANTSKSQARPDNGDEDLCGKQVVQQEGKNKHSEGKCFEGNKLAAETRKQFMSSTPSKDVKTKVMKAKMKEALSEGSSEPNTKLEQASLIFTHKAESELFKKATKAKMPVGEQGKDCGAVSIDEENKKYRETDRDSDSDSSKHSAFSESLSCKEEMESDERYQLNVSDIQINKDEDANRGSIENSSSETSCKDQSVDDATQFISCVGSEATDSSHTDKSEDECNKMNEDHSVREHQNELDVQKLKNEISLFEEQRDGDEIFVNRELTPDKGSLNNTVDEYESCSETCLENENIGSSRNSVDTIRRSIALENLSASSILSERSDLSYRESSHRVDSFLLSGSSFEGSALTDCTTSTLEKENEEIDDTSSQCEDDSCHEGQQSKPRTTSSSSSSSSVYTSDSTEQQESCLSSSKENTSIIESEKSTNLSVSENVEPRYVSMEKEDVSNQSKVDNPADLDDSERKANLHDNKPDVQKLNEKWLFEAPHDDEKILPDVELLIERESLNNTVDEYESCSESSPENRIGSPRNSVDTIRRNIALENLSTSSILSETSDLSYRESSHRVDSFLLSGSSFESSALTDCTTSTLEKENEEIDDTSSQCEDDSYQEGQQSKPRTTSSSSSSSSVYTSDSTEESCLSSSKKNTSIVESENSTNFNISENLETGNFNVEEDSSKQCEVENSATLDDSERKISVKDCSSHDANLPAKEVNKFDSSVVKTDETEGSQYAKEPSHALQAEANAPKNFNLTNEDTGVVDNEPKILPNPNEHREKYSSGEGQKSLESAVEDEAPVSELSVGLGCIETTDNFKKTIQANDNIPISGMNCSPPVTEQSQAEYKDVESADDAYYEDMESKDETRAPENHPDEEVLAGAPTVENDGSKTDTNPSSKDESQDTQQLKTEVEESQEIEGRGQEDYEDTADTTAKDED